MAARLAAGVSPRPRRIAKPSQIAAERSRPFRSEQPARPEERDERSGRQRVREGLREVEPAFVRPHPPQPREAAPGVDRQAAARPLQEDPLRPAGILEADPLEVALLEAQVEVARQAPRHRVVGGAVAPDLAPRGARQVERQRRACEQHRERGQHHSRLTLAHAPAADHSHPA